MIPKVKGGTDDPTNIITVCDTHHHKLHNMRQNADMYRLCKIGREAAMARGVKFGRKRTYTPKQASDVWEVRKEGKGYGTIAKELNMSKSMVRRIINLGKDETCIS